MSSAYFKKIDFSPLILIPIYMALISSIEILIKLLNITDASINYCFKAIFIYNFIV